MSDALTRRTREPALGERLAAAGVVQKCLELQANAHPHGAFARLTGRSVLSADAESWFRGAIGELEVAAQLARLGYGWGVIHAVPVGPGDTDIDHVVVGPGGVFTINTKNHAGRRVWAAGRTFMVSGQKQKHIFAAVAESRKASQLISQIAGVAVPVTALIVVVRPHSLTARQTDVPVVASAAIVRWLRNRPVVLSDAAVAGLTLIASERATWTAVPLAVVDSTQMMERFERLRRDVAAADNRRRVVGVSVPLIGAVMTLGVINWMLVPLVRFLLGDS